MTTASAAVVEDLAPSGILRASINLGNPVLAQGTPEAPAGVTVDLAREVGARLGVPLELLGTTRSRRPDTVAFLRDLVEELKASGFVAAALARSGQSDASVSPAADIRSDPS